MKKNFLSWFFFSLCLAVGFTACDDDDDDATTSVAFPAKATLTADAGETKEITFDATTNWTLTSSELWTTFLNGEAEEYSLSGQAGKQTVKVKVSDIGQGNEAKSVAHITMSYGDKSAIIADIERNAKGFSFVMKDAEGNVIDPETGIIELAYDKYTSYTFESNFRFAATNRPDWVEIEGGSIVGAPGHTTTGKLQFVENGVSKKYAIGADKGNTITFSDEKGAWSKSYKVSFKGMNPESIDWEGPQNFNWIVSLDGTSFTQTTQNGLDGSSSSSTYNKYIPFNISCLEDDYVPVLFQVVEEWGMKRISMASDEEPILWMRLEDKGRGKARLYVDQIYPEEGISEREGFVLVFPRAEYERLTEEDLWYGMDEESNVVVSKMDPNTGAMNQEIAYYYSENNMLINFVQKEVKQGGTEDTPQFKVTYYDSSWNQVEAEVVKETDEAKLSEWGAEYGTKVYTMVQPETPMGFNVDPMEEGEYEADWLLSAFLGNGLFPNNDYQSISVDDGTNITVWLSEPITQDVSIVIKDAMTWQNKKVLIITPRQ